MPGTERRRKRIAAGCALTVVTFATAAMALPAVADPALPTGLSVATPRSPSRRPSTRSRRRLATWTRSPSSASAGSWLAAVRA